MDRTGIDEAMIERLVRGFYAKVRTDAVLAPIFEARIPDWEPHLAQMCAFWSSVALMTGRYHGTPMAKHLPLPVDADHFDRWLELFEETAREVCPPEAAGAFRRTGAADRRQPRTRHRRRAGRHARQRRTISARQVKQQEISDEASDPVATCHDRYKAGAGAGNPYAGSSLVPMLVIGIVLMLVGMIAAVMLS